MAVNPTRRLFTVDEYHRMADAGIFSEDDRIELIGGEIVQMTPIGTRHASTVARLTELFITGLSGRAYLWPQNPAVLDDLSEPQPDICVLRRREDDYSRAHPRPEDLLLVVEVSDASLAFDRDAKLPRYALAGVPESWIVDLVSDRIVAYRKPRPSGYESAVTFERGSHISPERFDDLRLAVDDIIPAR
jgi:Uma2 family endonuclease